VFGLGRELLLLSFLASNKTDYEALGFLAACGAETLAEGNMFFGIVDYSR